MAQLLQSNSSVTAIGASEILTVTPAALNRQFLLKSGALAMKKLEAELNEHRYYLERKVEQRTEQLMKRITLLESCNASLCNKLAQTKRDIAALHKQLDSSLPDTKSRDFPGQLIVIGDGARIQAEPDTRMAGLGV